MEEFRVNDNPDKPYLTIFNINESLDVFRQQCRRLAELSGYKGEDGSKRHSGVRFQFYNPDEIYSWEGLMIAAMETMSRQLEEAKAVNDEVQFAIEKTVEENSPNWPMFWLIVMVIIGIFLAAAVISGHGR